MMADNTQLNGLDVSRETIEKLHTYCELIAKWTKRINLIAPNTVNDMWDRHIIDSAQVFQYASPNWTRWIDIGSGAGLPGIVIAMLARPDQQVTLVESDTRKSLFLNTVRRELSLLNVTVLNKRIESIDIGPTHVISARALASLPDLLVHAERLLDPSGVALFSKGVKFQEELDAAMKNWQFDCNSHLSSTSPDARVLELSRIRVRES